MKKTVEKNDGGPAFACCVTKTCPGQPGRKGKFIDVDSGRLIAAAPELLKAAKNAIDVFKTDGRFNGEMAAVAQLEIAIAKAEGKEWHNEHSRENPEGHCQDHRKTVGVTAGTAFRQRSL